MSKLSRRKQLKPQHLLNDDDDEKGDSKNDNSPKKPDTPRTKMDRANNNMEDRTPDASDNASDSDIPAEEQSKLVIDDFTGKKDDNSDASFSVKSSLGGENTVSTSTACMKRGLESPNALRMQLRENAGFRHGNQLTPIRECRPRPKVRHPEDGLGDYRPRHKAPHLEDRTCPYCGAVKKSPADLERHLRKHTGERPFPCQLCSKAFKAKRSLQYHQYMHHGLEQKDSNISQRYKGIRKRKLELEKLRSEIITDMDSKEPEPELDPDCLKSQVCSKKVKIEVEEETEKLFENKTPHNILESQTETSSSKSDLKFESEVGALTDILIKKETERKNFKERLPVGDPSGDTGCLVESECQNEMNLDRVNSSTIKCVNSAIEDKSRGYDGVEDENNGSQNDSNLGKSNIHALNEINCDIGEFDCTNGQVGQRVCQICGKICLKPSDLKRHLMVHTGERPFKCDVCGKPFKAKNSMLYHQKAAHGMDIELSPGLEERFLRLKYRSHKNYPLYRDQLLQSEEMHNIGLDSSRIDDLDLDDADSKSTDSSFAPIWQSGLSESKVPQTFASSWQSGLQNGDIEVDDQGSLNTSQSQNLQVGQCPSTSPLLQKTDFDEGSAPSEGSSEQGIVRSVGMNVGTAGSLVGSIISTMAPFSKNRISIKNETVIVSRLDGVDVMSGDSVSLYKCYLCGKVFNYLSKLQCHLSLHFEREIVRYECHLCDSSFQFKTQMVHHVRRKHGKGKPNRVAHNSDSFSSGLSQSSGSADWSDQKRGENTALLQRPKQTSFRKLNGSYVCVYCRKTFKYILALQHHMQIHRAVKLVYCKECGKGFADNKSLGNHILHIHRSRGPDMVDKNMPNSSHNKSLGGQVEMDNIDDFEKARELLEQEGIKEDVTVVMPSDPPGEQTDGVSDDQHSISSENNWSDTGSEQDPREESPNSEIMSAPKRSLLPLKKEGRPKRKSAQPVRVDNCLGGSSTPTLEALIKEERTEVAASCAGLLGPSVISPSSAALALPTVNSMLLSSPLSLVPNPQGSILVSASSVIPGFSTGLSTSQVLGLPISVQVPADHLGHLKTPSPSLSSKSDPSPSERDNLVGYPRVQWGPGECPTSPSLQWHNYMDGRTGISSDGRKVTSLSRTHSRLPIVNAPVNRDQVCKPTALNDGRTVYRCPFCSKDFLSYSDINRHMDFHEDIRPYKCKFCDYYARTNSQLKVHMMRHQGIREFCCKLCNYKGVTQSDLNRHMKSQIHLLKSRNECDQCGEGFVTSKNLEKHQMSNCLDKLQNCNDVATWEGQENIGTTDS